MKLETVTLLMLCVFVFLAYQTEAKRSLRKKAKTHNKDSNKSFSSKYKANKASMSSKSRGLKDKQNKESRADKNMFINTWVVRVVGDEQMAQKVAHDYGFVYKGKVFEDIYEFVHRGVPKRRKRASFIKTLRLAEDHRVRWTQQQASKSRTKRSLNFNDEKWSDQWFIQNPEFNGHDMNILPVWKRGITGKGVVISVIDDGLEYTHPDLKDNYDPKASYDYNNNDTDPMPRYTWRDDNRHGTRCAGEIAAAANNSNCVVGVAYGASIGGIRMLDGEITDLVESRSLKHAMDHIDIYSSSWGPDDDGRTVEGPGPLTRQILASGAKHGRKGKGSIYVWASGNGGKYNDNCNCDGYTNSIYTISVSAATSVGDKPWYLETCASTLVATYSGGNRKYDKFITTADLRGKCTDRHTGTSVAPPYVAGVLALALEVNPSITWRDAQHLLVETSSLDNLIGSDFKTNGAGKKFSHSFGFGMINAGKLVDLAEKWPTISDQHACFIKKNIQPFPHNRFNKSTPLVLELNTTACHGTTQFVRYVEHVQLVTSLYHYQRGSTEISIKSPMGTESWLLRRRSKDERGGEFNGWKFLSVHFWGENPTGKWTISFMSSESDDYGQGYLQDMKLIIYGTEHKPGKQPDEGETDIYDCHSQCLLTCTGPESYQCDQCKNKYYINNIGQMICVEKCPLKTYQKPSTSECLPCHISCRSCSGNKTTDCISCSENTALFKGLCVATCPESMFKLEDIHMRKTYHCQHCDKRCAHCIGASNNCSACHKGSKLLGNKCLAACADDEWLDGETCRKCHPTCKTCAGGSQFDCKSCHKKSLNDASDRFLYKSNQCVDACPIGTYVGESVMKECKDCPGNCLQCSGNGRKCDICDVEYFLVADDRKCVKQCSEGYYTDYIRRLCEPCDSQCKSCVPGRPKACTSCQGNFFLKDQNCISKEECQSTVFVNKTSGTCDVCPFRCKVCQSADYCTECWLSYYLTTDKKCLDKCPKGSYSQATLQCGDCASECSECNGPTKYDCTACPIGKHLLDGKCIDKIPSGYYVETVNSNNSLCRICHHTCKECNGPTEYNCTTCIDNLDMRDKMCLNPCPSQWLSNNDCQSCHPSCTQCFGPKESDCLKCSDNYALNVATRTCNKVCPRKFYKDVETSTCRPCHQSCGTCFGPSPNQCKSCQTKLNFFNNTCVLQCPTGWYSTYGGICEQCSPRCKKCKYKFDLCTDCHSHQAWDDWKCFDQCIPRYFKNPHNNRCYPCHASCQTCNGTSPNQCLSCPLGNSLYNGMCLEGCLLGHYNSTKENQCLPCMKDCLKCKEDYNNLLRCSACSNKTLLLPNSTCGDKCPVGTYKVKTNNVCQKCPGKRCLDCSKDHGKTCSKCEPLYQLSNGLCKSTCGRGSYPNSEKKKCSKCHHLCLECYGRNKNNCYQCKKKALTMLRRDKKIICVRECPHGYYREKNFCYPCDSKCKTCTQSKECETCSPPFIFFQGQCVTQCATGFYHSSEENMCISCEVFTNCSTCNQKKCLSCKHNMSLDEKHECITHCGGGFISLNGRCTPCISLFPNCRICNSKMCLECLSGIERIQGKCISEGLIQNHLDANTTSSIKRTEMQNINTTTAATTTSKEEIQKATILFATTTETLNATTKENPKTPSELKANEAQLKVTTKQKPENLKLETTTIRNILKQQATIATTDAALTATRTRKSATPSYIPAVDGPEGKQTNFQMNDQMINKEQQSEEILVGGEQREINKDDDINDENNSNVESEDVDSTDGRSAFFSMENDDGVLSSSTGFVQTTPSDKKKGELNEHQTTASQEPLNIATPKEQHKKTVNHELKKVIRVEKNKIKVLSNQTSNPPTNIIRNITKKSIRIEPENIPKARVRRNVDDVAIDDASHGKLIKSNYHILLFASTGLLTVVILVVFLWKRRNNAF